MNNIPRKRSNSLTRKKAKVRMDYLWPKYLLVFLLTITLSIIFFYKVYDGGQITGFLLRIVELESINKEYDKNILEKSLEIQMRSISYDKLAQELVVVKQQNIELKEDVLFFEKIVGKRPK
tara:strand:+ start:550 stop:912 length:363 start_codon:yes stop_codon:yes gene_type:complete